MRGDSEFSDWLDALRDDPVPFPAGGAGDLAEAAPNRPASASADPAAERRARVAPIQPPVRHEASGTVALIEDGAADVAAFRRVFREFGEVTCWGSGEEALEALRSGRPGVAELAMLVVDINLPGMNGVEVIRAVRQLPGGANPAIFALSGVEHQATIDAALLAGADDYHLKPHSLGDLRRLVTDLVRLTAESGDHTDGDELRAHRPAGAH
ncbi:MAG: response regulator [Solirubrobacteraceae bacterium]|nr:response regulator [Patulibacter sp.]